MQAIADWAALDPGHGLAVCLGVLLLTLVAMDAVAVLATWSIYQAVSLVDWLTRREL